MHAGDLNLSDLPAADRLSRVPGTLGLHCLQAYAGSHAFIQKKNFYR